MGRRDIQQEVRDSVEGYTDKELVEVLATVLEEDEYEENDYTDLTKDIMAKYEKFGSMSAKQRKVLDMHMIVNWKLWF